MSPIKHHFPNEIYGGRCSIQAVGTTEGYVYRAFGHMKSDKNI